MVMATDDRYTIISADCHAGANHATYREYLEEKYLDDFDAWRGEYKNPFRDLQDGGRVRNWDNERRLGDLHADGQVGEGTSVAAMDAIVWALPFTAAPGSHPIRDWLGPVLRGLYDDAR